MSLSQSARLTPVQRKHLSELAELWDKDAAHEAYWRPFSGGDWKSAIALAERGLLKQEFGDMARGSVFSLTDAGREAVR